ncbi:TonB-dependent receptor domain-containing protein [Paraburkholderia diazotrophica]|uniref:Vitamin B12 transporter n=1 Tax=Paraburkholderia diazotrophica TaxID=667676 RepID=A0A1H6TWF6_9BURK|nr:TonB-dependent receptor [Paraburkholderia diazotrophica]SEI84373.1 vitamin B12 transporter [Paraburkholderia diazotrophica]
MLTPLFPRVARAPYAALAVLAYALSYAPFAACAQTDAQSQTQSPDHHADSSAMTTDQPDSGAGKPSSKPSAKSSASTISTDAGADAPTLSPIVVTAERGAQRLADAIPQTTLFDAQDIADTTARDLPGLLQLAPGAQIVRNGGPGSTSSLFLRGASATQSLVLIDGVRVDSVSQGSAQLEQIPLDQIDHVEVVNGNVSALYGSGAIGGVVQVFTKDGGNHPPRFHFELEYGSYHTQRQAAGVDGALDKDGKTTFSVTLARAKTDGFSSIDPTLAPVNPNANGYFNESASASLRHRFNDQWDVGLRYFQSNGNDSFDNPFGLPTDLNNLHSKVQTASAFANGKLTEWWTTHFIAATGNDRSNTALNGDYLYRYDSDNRQYTWQNDLTFARDHKLQIGYEHLDQTLDSNQYTAPDRHVNSVFAGYSGRLGNNQIQANVRRDQYSDFGGANSYYLGYGYDFDEHWKATASWSDAFRAPSFNDLYYPFSGNPLIQPERSHSVEAALQYASDALGLMKLTAFETRYTNLIDYVQTTPGIYVAENVGHAKVQGIEGSWAGHVGRTDVRAAVTFQNPVDEDTHTDLNRRARHFASFAANRNIGSWRVGGEWLLSGERVDGGTPLGGYGIVNLSARYRITKAWYVAAQIQNLFDKDYELAYTYNTPRRGAYITLGWQQQ